MKKHKDSEHSDYSESVKCPVCDKIYKNEATLKTHMYCHGDRTLRMCDICGKEFKSNVLKVSKEHKCVIVNTCRTY